MEINQPSSSSNGGLPLGNGQKPGERLRQVRVSQKREIVDVSRELNIPQHILIALEADDYAALPQAAFIRGYLRSYAKFLGVDGNALVARFSEIYIADTGRTATQTLDDSPLRPLAKISSRQYRQNWRRLRWLLLLLLVGALLYAAVQGFSAGEPSLDTPASPAAAVDTPPAQASEPVDVLPIPQVTAQTVVTPTALPIQAAPATVSDRLLIQLSRAAIVQVKDATGKALLSGHQAFEQPLQIEGQSPFSITLPEAEAVQQLSLNGEQVRLTPYIVKGRADFRLSR